MATTQTIEVASSSVASQYEKKEENAVATSIDYKDQSDQKGQSIVSEQKEQMQIEEHYSEHIEERTSEKAVENKE